MAAMSEATPKTKVSLSPDPLDPMEAINFVSGDNSTGAISIFIGTTRMFEYSDRPVGDHGCRKEDKVTINHENNGDHNEILKSGQLDEKNRLTGVIPSSRIEESPSGSPAANGHHDNHNSYGEDDSSEGRTQRTGYQIISSLFYEAYEEMALKVMREIVSRIQLEYQLNKCFVVHRTGLVGVGNPSVIISCSSSHRKESHEAVMKILNEIKAKVPIWKKVIPPQCLDVHKSGQWSQKSEAFWIDHKK